MKNILTLLLVASCSATMVQDPKSRPKFAPKNYVQKGVVKYLNQGASFAINKRRENAFEQAHESCDGEFEVIHEAPANSGYWSSANQFGGFNVYSSEYILIEFVCSGGSNSTASLPSSDEIDKMKEEK